jgi:CheY-like chemotaxis protein
VATKILIVEDNGDNIELMRYLLEAFGYAPLIATNGAEGIRLARETYPDLILMDVHMPEMDGWVATDAIKRQPGFEACPVIAVTAFAMVGDKRRILASGFDGYISKPIAPEKFIAQIEAFLPEELRRGARASTESP